MITRNQTAELIDSILQMGDLTQWWVRERAIDLLFKRVSESEKAIEKAYRDDRYDEGYNDGYDAACESACEDQHAYDSGYKEGIAAAKRAVAALSPTSSGSPSYSLDESLAGS